MTATDAFEAWWERQGSDEVRAGFGVVARAAWDAATERAAKVAECEDKVAPDDDRHDTHVCGWNDACFHIAAQIRGGAP